MNAAKVYSLLESYYQAFNDQDMIAFFDLIDDDVIHDVNEGQREEGKVAFRFFMEKMNRNYQEKIDDLVIMTDPMGRRAAAEFTVTGTYLEKEFGLPEAKGQSYRLSSGAFFEFKNGLISRVTNYYNLANWIEQVEQKHSL